MNRVFKIVDEFAPGFSDSIIGVDALSPLDLEFEFGLHKGNIFHGALGLHQIGFLRNSHRSPLEGLYLAVSHKHSCFLDLL